MKANESFVRFRLPAGLAAIAAVCAGLALLAGSATANAPRPAATHAAGSGAGSYHGGELGLPSRYNAPKVKHGYKFTVGWLIPNASIPSLGEISAGVKAEVARLGGKVIILNSNLSPQTEVNNFNQLIAEKVQGIIDYPINPTSLVPSLKQAKAAGIPVINIDTPSQAGQPLLADTISDILIGRDRGTFDLGQEAAKVAPGAQFATLGLALPIPTLEYVVGRDRYWASKDGLKFDGEVDSQADTSVGGATAMASLLAKYPNVKVVFTYNDVSAVGAAAQARTNGDTKVKVFGFNGEVEALQAIKAKQLFATFDVPFEENGVQAVDGLYDTLTHQGPSLPKQIDGVGQLVTSN